ncbi:MAG: Fic family protein [Actinomycetota bacterium]|nr:Fic family protein [Actinomycetota bacterium]
MPQRSNSVEGGRRGRGRPPRREIYARLDAAIGELRDRLGGLPSPAEARTIWDDIWVHEAHNSTAIEGNTLVLRQVEQLLREGRAVGNKQLAEYLEVQGYAEAARWVYSQALEPGHEPPRSLLTLTELRHVHRLAMNPVWEVAPHPESTPAESPGNFRQHDIRAFPSGMTPPSHALVPARLRDWLDEVARLDAHGDRHLMERLAAVHARFEQVHPFLDGNGRAGRLALNLLLARLGYPPAIIRKRERWRYLQALRAADADNYGPLAELLARAVLDNLYRFVVPALAGPVRLVPLAALATTEVSAVALRNAAQRGRLQAQRGPDGQWRSSRAWVEDYLSRRYQRNPT